MEADASDLEIIAAGDGEKKLKKFRMVAYNGGPMRVSGFYYPVIVDLTGVRGRGQKRPILRDHDAGQIVGHSEVISIEPQAIRLEGVLSADNEYAREVASLAGNGFPWKASIGASADKVVLVDKGESVEVNGKQFTGPVYVARKTTLREVSFVAMAADDSTSAKVAANQKKGLKMEDFEKWLEAQGIATDEISDRVRDVLKAEFEAEVKQRAGETAAASEGVQAAAPASAGNQSPAGSYPPAGALPESGADFHANYLQQRRRQFAEEAERVERIEEICASHPGLKIPVDDQQVSLQAHAIAEGWEPTRVELEVLRASRPAAPQQEATADPKQAEPIIAALLCSVGLDEAEVAELTSKKAMDVAASAAYRGYTLHQLMGHVIRAAGKHYSGSHKSDDFIRATYEAERTLTASGFTTLTLSNILEAVANKTLLAAYRAQEVVWNKICRTTNHSDFKVHSRYRLDVEGAFQKVAADGELKHASLADAKYTNQIDTHGALISLTRQDQINDDLDAFLQIPRALGRLSAIKIEEVVFKLLLSNPSSFFSTGNGNYFTGTTSALSADSLTTGKKMFLNMVDSNGKPILVSPAVLLVPTTLDDTANVLMVERDLIAGTSTAKQPKRNPHVGTLKQVTTPYLNNTAITDSDGTALTGQSDTAWYLFANPSVRAAMTVAFLNGKRTPTIQSGETSFDTLGMQWRGYHDFGVAMEDTVAAVKSKGAA